MNWRCSLFLHLLEHLLKTESFLPPMSDRAWKVTMKFICITVRVCVCAHVIVTQMFLLEAILISWNFLGASHFSFTLSDLLVELFLIKSFFSCPICSHVPFSLLRFNVLSCNHSYHKTIHFDCFINNQFLVFDLLYFCFLFSYIITSIFLGNLFYS